MTQVVKDSGGLVGGSTSPNENKNLFIKKIKFLKIEVIIIFLFISKNEKIGKAGYRVIWYI